MYAASEATRPLHQSLPVKARERHMLQRQERARAGTEEAVVETGRGDDEGEAERAGAGVAINAAHRRREQEIEPHRDQENGHEGGEEIRAERKSTRLKYSH